MSGGTTVVLESVGLIVLTSSTCPPLMSGGTTVVLESVSLIVLTSSTCPPLMSGGTTVVLESVGLICQVVTSLHSFRFVCAAKLVEGGVDSLFPLQWLSVLFVQPSQTLFPLLWLYFVEGGVDSLFPLLWLFICGGRCG